MMNLKYIFGAICTIPCLPILYFQGKNLRKTIPALPEATGTKGVSGVKNQESFRLLTIGESTIAGVGVATHEKGFTGTLAHTLSHELDLKIDWNVYAKSGFTAKKIQHKTIPTIVETEVDLIVIGLGGNDAFQLHSPQRWQKDIRLLIESLQKKFGQTPIFFTNMPPIKEFPAFTRLMKFSIGNLVELLGKELKRIVNDFEGVYYNSEIITLEKWLKRYDLEGTPNTFFSDGVHPSPLTYQIWARDFAYFIMDNINLNKKAVSV